MPDFYAKETYNYYLPPEQIAQVPATPRDSCRLLSMNRNTGVLQDLHFYDLPSLLKEGDLLIRNDTRVMAARLFGKRSGGGAAEMLLLRPLATGGWEGVVRPGKRLKPGSTVTVGETIVTIGERLTEDGTRAIYFPQEADVDKLMHDYGELPLPPYITSRASNDEDYQTIYSKEEKSAAAPTAGLHFTEELFSTLDKKGIEVADVTLEVGLGTFKPLNQDDIRNHIMHSERCMVPELTAQKIACAKNEGRRVIALGTTVVRTLESWAKNNQTGLFFSTDLFIHPGYDYTVVDGLITNFHLPESTLLMLVVAFAGYEPTMQAYKHAVETGYRFFSFGDAMAIL